MAIKSGHSFPADFGFTGSCGKHAVKGYQRGRLVRDATFDSKASSGEGVKPRGTKPGGPTFDNKRGSGESIKPGHRTDTTMPVGSSTKAAPAKPRQPPVAGTPKGALQQKGDLMPGYKAGGRPSTPDRFKRGGREC